MKKLLLEFYRELLPVFEKYKASIDVRILGDATIFFDIYATNTTEGDWRQEDQTVYNGSQEINASFFQHRIEELQK
jgi:hypothetical protein